MNEEKPTCLECGKALYGRPDKRYCSRSCKNSHYNRQRHLSDSFRRWTLDILMSNYSILDLMLRSGSTTVQMKDIVAAGFRPDVVTGHRKGAKGHEEYSCFDIAYYQSDMKVFGIRRRE